MKTALLALVVIGVAAALHLGAASARLAWDASPTTGVTNYVLYAHTNTLAANTLTNAVVRLPLGTNLTATVEDLRPGQWSFAVTAEKDGLESDPSNVLNVQMPEPPTNARIVVIEHSVDLTNFHNVGYFRLRLP